jgi:hypothetical protein
MLMQASTRIIRVPRIADRETYIAVRDFSELAPHICERRLGRAIGHIADVARFAGVSV